MKVTKVFIYSKKIFDYGKERSNGNIEGLLR